MSSPSAPSHTTWLARIEVTRKSGVVDPQGNTVRDALHQLRFATVSHVRIGKYIEVTLQGSSHEEVEEQVRAMCDTLLINPVIEHYHYSIEPVGA